MPINQHLTTKTIETPSKLGLENPISNLSRPIQVGGKTWKTQFYTPKTRVSPHFHLRSQDSVAQGHLDGHAAWGNAGKGDPSKWRV